MSVGLRKADRRTKAARGSGATPSFFLSISLPTPANHQPPSIDFFLRYRHHRASTSTQWPSRNLIIPIEGACLQHCQLRTQPQWLFRTRPTYQHTRPPRKGPTRPRPQLLKSPNWRMLKAKKVYPPPRTRRHRRHRRHRIFCRRPQCPFHRTPNQ